MYGELRSEGDLLIYDLCCGKSYLSFAVYHYFTVIKQRNVYMLGIDLKKDVIDFCSSKAEELGYSGLRFITDDITNTPKDTAPDMVISLHACDIATDIVLGTAAQLGAKVILSTPCCHRELSTKINAKELSFVTDYPKLKRTLCDALTDALRLKRLEALGYEVNATELVDPEDTPKNTLIRAVKRNTGTHAKKNEYESLLAFLMGEDAKNYIGRL
jgi:SAM-dependent methyltransferase